jgi:hypothetical protein
MFIAAEFEYYFSYIALVDGGGRKRKGKGREAKWGTNSLLLRYSIGSNISIIVIYFRSRDEILQLALALQLLPYGLLYQLLVDLSGRSTWKRLPGEKDGTCLGNLKSGQFSAHVGHEFLGRYLDTFLGHHEEAHHLTESFVGEGEGSTFADGGMGVKGSWEGLRWREEEQGEGWEGGEGGEGGGRNGPKSKKQTLYFSAGNVLPTTYDDILGPVHDVYEPIVVDLCYVLGLNQKLDLSRIKKSTSEKSDNFKKN